jgi:hypothetical protein
MFTKYFSRDQIKKNEMGGVYSTQGKVAAYRNLVKKTDGKRTLGTPRRILADIINVYFQGYGDTKWTNLA